MLCVVTWLPFRFPLFVFGCVSVGVAFLLRLVVCSGVWTQRFASWFVCFV